MAMSPYISINQFFNSSADFNGLQSLNEVVSRSRPLAVDASRLIAGHDDRTTSTH